MEAMAKFTLIERPAPGGPPADQTFVPPESPVPHRRQKSVGDQQLIIDRALVDKNGNQLGSFVLHAPADVVCHRAPPHHWLANVVLVRPAPDQRAPSFLDVESDARTTEVSAD
jgi:hypothetical protein